MTLRIHERMNPEHVAWVVARHCIANGIAETRFGRSALNDPRLLGDLRNGRRLGPVRIDRVNAALAGEA